MLMSVIGSEKTFSLVLFSLFLTIMPPAFHYLKMKKSRKLYVSKNLQDFFPEITIFLPMKNESINVKRKLNEVNSMSYPREKLNLLLIDSGSSDGTREIAEEYLNSKSDFFNWEIFSIDLPGKSRAVNKALEVIETPFIVMMDTDAICPPDSLVKLMKNFSNPTIGGVCGHQNPSFGKKEDPYRSRFNDIRIGESSFHSTPIFEGSLCAFRVKSLGGRGVDEEINADDSQLAMLTVSNGYRSVMLTDLSFSEPSNIISRKRRVRRAQGLSRALWKNRKLIFLDGPMGKIFFQAVYFYIFFPWLFSISIALLLSSFFQILISEGLYLGDVPLLLPILLPIVLFSGNIRSLISGISVLIESHLRYFIGQRLQVWEPDRINNNN